jgi:hypothetical protein
MDSVRFSQITIRKANMNEDQARNTFVFSVLRKLDGINHQQVADRSDTIIDFLYDNYDLLHYLGVNGAVHEASEELGITVD